MMNFRLSESDFRLTVDAMTMAKRPQSAAYMVVVDGFSLVKAGELLGISKEAVRKAVLRVRSAWWDANLDAVSASKKAAIGLLKEEMLTAGIPDDWEPVAVYLPKKMAKTIKNLEIEKLRELSNNNN